ncbi:MAG: DUF559 domain-containing protein [archaeon]|nr:DUF559 domain-containing protein [archaeon]
MEKLCECGCGKEVSRWNETYNRRGIKKGDFHRYIHGHNKARLGLKFTQEGIENIKKGIRNKFPDGKPINSGSFKKGQISHNTGKKDLNKYLIINCLNCNKEKEILKITNNKFCLHKCYIDYKKQNPELYIMKSHKPWNKGLPKEQSHRFGKNHTIETKKQMRLSTIKYIEEQQKDGLPIAPRRGKYETKIIDFLEKATGYKFFRQYKIDGYFIDGYCPILKLAIEVDEKYHQKQLQKDLERQKYIENKLSCTFMRIKVNT